MMRTRKSRRLAPAGGFSSVARRRTRWVRSSASWTFTSAWSSARWMSRTTSASNASSTVDPRAIFWSTPRRDFPSESRTIDAHSFRCFRREEGTSYSLRYRTAFGPLCAVLRCGRRVRLLRIGGASFGGSMSPEATAVPKPPPPKLNPVRVTIAEEPVEARTTDFREVLHAYSKEDAILEAKRCIQCRRPWCVEACPISQDCREYITLVADGDFDGAARVTIQDNPLSTCLCKVCYHYREDSCVVKKKGVPIAIRHLKRASLELGNSDLAYVASKPRGQRIAVVGGGPAGIMMAWELGIRGYAVTVFEQERFLGGLMQTIPAYRMTDADVQVDKARFRDLDVTWVTDTKVGVEYPPSALLQQGYQAVFISIG